MQPIQKLSTLILSLAPAILTAAPVNVALNQYAEADSVSSAAYVAANAVDGDATSDASRWLSSGDAMPHWIEVDLGQHYVLSQMKFWTGKQGVGPFPLYDFALQYWNGAGWTELYSETASTNTGSVDVSFGPTVAGNRVRLHVTAGEDSIVRLFELEIYGEPYALGYTGVFPIARDILYDMAADLTVTFDAAVSPVDLTGIRIENVDTGTDLSGVVASVSGSTLTLSHGGLTENDGYVVHIPSGAVALASDAAVLNAPLSWRFATSPLRPQLESYSDELPELSGDFTFVFDRAVSIADAGGITVKRASDNTLLTGITASTSGNTLRISHPDPLVEDAAYVVVLADGALTGDINGAGIEPLRRLVFAGSSQLFNANFDDGMDGFQRARDWFVPAETWWAIWRRSDGSSIGPNSDNRFLISRTNWKEDFVVSPVVNLRADTEYTVRLRAKLEQSLKIGYIPTTAVPGSGTAADVIAAATQINTVASGGPKTVQVAFSPEADGAYHMIWFSGDVQANQDQEIDAIALTRAYDPVVSFISPATGSSFLESDTVTIEAEAFGISANIVRVDLYDDATLLGQMSLDGDRYTYDWAYHAPGSRALRAVAVDALGNTATSEIAVTITFNDGASAPYLGWNFDDGKQGWNFSVEGTAIRVLGSISKPGMDVRVGASAGDGLAISSPQVFLFAGETYTLQFRTLRWDTTQNYTWSFLVTAAAGYPADTTERQDFSINSGSWLDRQLTFTVPSNGPYHLTLFNPASSGYNKVAFDDVRILGNLNSIPSVTLTQPAANVSTFAGATLNLAAEAADLDGNIVSVAFRTAAGDLLAPDAIDTTEPFSYAWSDIPEGTFDVVAHATDNAGGFMDSAPRTVRVAPNQYSISTYVGAEADDEAFTGAAYLSDGTLVLSGIMDPALFPTVTPLYLNGAIAGDRGLIVRLSEDGRTVLSVTVVATRVLDLDTDDLDRLFIAAGNDGALVLNAAADTVLWTNDYGEPHAHRIDAAPGGTFAVLTSSTADYLSNKIYSGTNYVYDSAYTLHGSMGGVGAFTTDIAVHEASQTVVLIGWKNVALMEPPENDPDQSINPVDIPGMVGRAYDGTLKWRAYDWEKLDGGERFLNLITNNMADTRGCRVVIGSDGKVYAGIEFDGGNTPLRYDPFDLRVAVTSKIVGGDNYHTMFGTSTVPKTFVGRYDAPTGNFERGQWITNRTNTTRPDGSSDNTISVENGNLLVDKAGRIHVVGGSASGLPLTHDALPGINYTGGAYHLVYSPDFTSREFVSRLTLSTSTTLSDYMAIAISPNGHVATAGASISPYLYAVNAWQPAIASTKDAHFAVGTIDPYFKFQTGSHPRLFFNDSELQAIRARLGDEPYASMLAQLIAQRDFGEFYRAYNPADGKQLLQRAQASAFLYALTGDESYAGDARSDIESAWTIIGAAWNATSTKGLDLYWYATKLATAYDLCANSAAWDAGFNYAASKKLIEVATVIENNGGTEQPSDPGSNWAAARGSSAGIAFLATDHAYDADLLSSAHNRTVNFLNTNQGSGATRGWNPEGFGYTAFTIGSYLGPYAIAAKRAATGDLTGHTGLQWMPWTGFAGATSAINVYGLGGVKTDWSDDNAHIGGEGIYGLAFALAPDALKPGLRHAYDRLMGALTPYTTTYDSVRAGTFWSILYYPADIPPQDPTEIWDWHRGADDSGGLGIFTYRNAYADRDDILVQFKARLKAPSQSHDGPDGLGLRLIGLGTPFVVGGGRDLDVGERNQATVYPSNPDNDVTRNSNTGQLVAAPLLKPDGGGHVIASMATNNVGTTSHKRWLVTDFDSAGTGAEAVVIIADTSDNGLYWQLPTFIGNTVSASGNSFMITSAEGASLKGTILHPGGTPIITTGTKARGSGYAVQDVVAGNYNATLPQRDADAANFPLVEENRYLHIQGSGDGDFLVVLTMLGNGASHPDVSHISGAVADALVQVGNKNYALQGDTVLYSTGAAAPVAYAPPAATITFDADGKGTLNGAGSVQQVPYGSDAVEPMVAASSGYTFMGWDKAFSKVVKSMTVTALYDAMASGFGTWISDALYGLEPSAQGTLANPDGDAFSNLLEYAFVLNPASADGDGVVTVRQQSGNLILNYRVRDDASDLSVAPRYANDLSGAWSAVPVANISTVGSGPNYTEYEARMPIGAEPLFLSLQVTVME